MERMNQRKSKNKKHCKMLAMLMTFALLLCLLPDVKLAASAISLENLDGESVSSGDVELLDDVENPDTEVNINNTGEIFTNTIRPTEETTSAIPDTGDPIKDYLSFCARTTGGIESAVYYVFSDGSIDSSSELLDAVAIIAPAGGSEYESWETALAESAKHISYDPENNVLTLKDAEFQKLIVNKQEMTIWIQGDNKVHWERTTEESWYTGWSGLDVWDDCKLEAENGATLYCDEIWEKQSATEENDEWKAILRLLFFNVGGERLSEIKTISDIIDKYANMLELGSTVTRTNNPDGSVIFASTKTETIASGTSSNSAGNTAGANSNSSTSAGSDTDTQTKDTSSVAGTNYRSVSDADANIGTSAHTNAGKTDAQAAGEAIAAATVPAAETVSVPGGSSVQIQSVTAITNEAALAALPEFVTKVESATSQGVQKVLNFDLNASGSGVVSIQVGQQYAGYIAIVGHYTNNAWTLQQVKVDANGYIAPRFASFSPITVILTNQTSTIASLATTEPGVTASAPKTGETSANLWPLVLLLMVAAGTSLSGRRAKNR